MRGLRTLLVIMLSLSLTMSFCVSDGVALAKKSAKASVSKKSKKSKKRKNSKASKKSSSSKKKSKKKAGEKVTTKKVTMIIGEDYTASVDKASKYSWSSSNGKIVSVKKGVMKAKKAGNAEVTGKWGKKTVIFKVTVYGVSISKLAINVEDRDDLDKAGNLVLYLGNDDDDDDEDDNVLEEDDEEGSDDADDEDDEEEDDDDDEVDEEGADYGLSVSFTAKLKGKKISNAKAIKYSSGVDWSSSNKKVVTVNGKGELTIVGKGSAFITAEIGKKKAKLKVIVSEDMEEDNSPDEPDDEDESDE